MGPFADGHKGRTLQADTRRRSHSLDSHTLFLGDHSPPLGGRGYGWGLRGLGLCVLQHHLGDGLANLAAADDGGMGIFWKDDEEVVGHHVDVGGGLVEERSEVASLIVRVSQLLAIVGVAPSHALFALKEDMHIHISAMNLQHLLLLGQTFGVDIVDEELVALEYNLS